MSKRASKLGWFIAGAVALGWLGGGNDDKPRSTSAPSNFPQRDLTPQPPASFVRPPRNVEQPSDAEETLHTTANVNMRSEPNTSSSVITTIPKGSRVVALGHRGAWRSVRYGRRVGWVSSRYVSKERPLITSAPRPLSPVVQRRAGEAVRAAPANPRKGEPVRAGTYGQGCDCPYDRMRNGRLCGGNSAWSRPGGRSPRCYW